MYLKSIEVQGFKSFANKILFEFHDGITGIVGPNGSGKSNVADAVRWVLGEQSAKQLRGGNMQDVIFSGTENRNPQSYAKVSISLDNSDHTLNIDFDEVVITRKLYRSGESEYLLNNSSCRLKDVQELFYDTGIGKEGYSIIGQGQIDQILSGKPDDRRELFDEATGIVKFKRRKKQTEKKLENESNNLVRVNDILDELEKQVGPLEIQSKKAKEYLEYKDELKKFDINMFLISTENITGDEKDIKEKIDNLTVDYNDSNALLDGTKEEYTNLENQIDETNLEIENAKNSLQQTAVLKEQVEGKINVLEEQLKTQDVKDSNFSENLSKINGEIEKREKEKQKLEFENKGLKEELDNSNQDKDNAYKKLEEIKNEIEENNSLIQNKKNWLIEELNNRATLSGKAKQFDTLLEQNKKQKSEIASRLISIKSEEAKYQEEYKTRAEKLSDINEKIKEKENILNGQKQDLAELNESIIKIDKDISNAQSKFYMENSRLVSLKNITERYDGYTSSIKKVMDLKGKESGIRGVVADIIKTDKKYELAIEIALGNSIQNIVVDDELVGKKLISYLKKNHFGRATFLPLTFLKERKFKEEDALKESGVIGVASSLVKVDKKYEVLASSLLGGVLVTEDINCAIKISKKYTNRFKIVTLEGEVINPGGAMTGGAYKNSSNLLSRRREIEELEKQIKVLQKDLEKVQDNKEKAIASREQASNLIENFRKEVQDLSIIKHEIQIKLEESKGKIDECENRTNNLKEESKTFENKVNEAKIEKINTQEKLKKSENDEKETNLLIEKLQVKLEELKTKEKDIQDEADELGVLCARLSQKYNFVVENNDKLDKEISEYKKQLDELLDNNENNEKFRAEKKEEIKKLKDTIVNSKDLIENIKKEIEQKEALRLELNNKHKVFIDKREALINHINELDKEKYRLENKLKNLEESFENQVNYMWEEYELTYDTAKELRDNELNDTSFMRRRINELKRDIRNLGMVNVNAIEEFKNVGKRYEFLKTQRDDLITARKTLMDIIKELDEGMIKQFNEQFKYINEEYDKVFKKLFGGGKGYLELLEDDNVLETGIKIIAQPPGKKLQNMMQLSGGEKALTAIALLFAIQNLKPSPFCLLDEIEAALDDSNVDKFADYLHDMTKNTQFIVITHRRGTMTSADRLYGITMQEKGVSALVSVDLVEGDLTN